MSALSPNRDAILHAVEAQHSRLINVVSVIRCMKSSDEAGELKGALELVEENLQDVLDRLEGPQLLKAAAESAGEAAEGNAP